MRWFAALVLLAPLPAAADAGLAKAACAGEKGCRLVEKHTAGKGLTVVKLALKRTPEDACDPFRWVLVSTQPPATQRLADLCNDGYGAAGMGEDEVEVKKGRFVHAQSGGSSWRWTNVREVSLAPVRVVGAAHRQPAADAPPPEDAALEYDFLPIPRLALPPELGDGWRTTELAGCALRLDSSGRRSENDPVPGFLVHGKPGQAGDARVAVLADEQHLYVEIHDDRWQSGAARWIFDDHLELWLAEKAPRYMTHCLAPGDAGKAVQWGIRLADGKVFAAAGKPSGTLDVVVVPPAAGGPARVRIRLPEKTDALTLVYSDSDDGKTQERLLATSKLAGGKTWTLGGLHQVAPERSRCVVEGGKLVLRPGPPLKADEPPP